MWTENLCGANLSYYEMCERNVKVWIPFIPWDSQLCMLWLTQTKKITNLKLFDMCMWTKLSTKITNKILNKIKNFPTYLMGFFGAWNPNKNIFKTGLIVCLNNLSDPEDVVVPLPDTQCLTSFCVNIKVLSSGYKLTVLSGLWSSNNIDCYYMSTTSNGVSKCDHIKF